MTTRTSAWFWAPYKDYPSSWEGPFKTSDEAKSDARSKPDEWGETFFVGKGHYPDPVELFFDYNGIDVLVDNLLEDLEEDATSEGYYAEEPLFVIDAEQRREAEDALKRALAGWASVWVETTSVWVETTQGTISVEDMEECGE